MKEIKISKKEWQKSKARILAETPGYPEYAAENGAAREVLALPGAKLFGGNKAEGWTFTLHQKATPKAVLAYFGAKQFPVTLDNVQYTEKGGIVYAHASGGNMSRSMWAKGKPVETIVTGKVLVKLD